MSATMTTTTIGAIQFLPETLSFILPRSRVYAYATTTPMSISKTIPVTAASLTCGLVRTGSSLRHPAARREAAAIARPECPATLCDLPGRVARGEVP